jgi:hypothetical protein
MSSDVRSEGKVQKRMVFEKIVYMPSSDQSGKSSWSCLTLARYFASGTPAEAGSVRLNFALEYVDIGTDEDEDGGDDEGDVDGEGMEGG